MQHDSDMKDLIYKHKSKVSFHENRSKQNCMKWREYLTQWWLELDIILWNAVAKNEPRLWNALKLTWNLFSFTGRCVFSKGPEDIKIYHRTSVSYGFMYVLMNHGHAYVYLFYLVQNNNSCNIFVKTKIVHKERLVLYIIPDTLPSIFQTHSHIKIQNIWI